MIPKTIVEYNQTGLEKVINALIELEEENFIEGIHNRHYSIYEIKQTTQKVKQQQVLVDIENNGLQEFASTFISDYATKNNKCFNTAVTLCRKIKSALKALKDVFKKTSPIDRRRFPESVETPSVFDISPLSKGASSCDIFGMASYSEEVKELYNAINKLFTTASSMLDLCEKIIELEESTRNDIVQLRYYYKKTCEEIAESLNGLQASFKPLEELPLNELELRRQKVGTDDDEIFLKENYHEHHKDDMKQYVLIKIIREAHNHGLTPLESKLWHKNHQKAMMVRDVIKQFDQLDGVEGIKGKLSKWTIVEFLKWCDVPESMEKELYLYYFVPKYKADNKLTPLAWSGISYTRKLLKSNGKTDEQLSKEFSNRIPSYMLLEKNEVMRVGGSKKLG